MAQDPTTSGQTTITTPTMGAPTTGVPTIRGSGTGPQPMRQPGPQFIHPQPQQPPVALPQTPPPPLQPGVSRAADAPQPGAAPQPGITPRPLPAVVVPADTAQRTEFQEFVAQWVGRYLPIFGANLFEGVPTTFAPVDAIPVTPDYVVGPGDEILIRASGQVDIDFRAVVDRNGMINIPRVGNVNVAGIRYQDLTGYLRTAIGRIFRNFQLNVALGQLRSIQVFVVGHARRPGSYTVSSLSTLVNALFASGGPSAKGSMRKIELKRGGQTVTEFDLYDLLLERYRTRSVIVTSNRGPDEWLATFADPVRAQSAIDRFTSNAYDLVIDGESYRPRLKPRLAKEKERALGAKGGRLTLESLKEQIAEGGVKELPLIVKADVQGSAEVLAETLTKLSDEKVKIRIIRSGVGAINESDVLLASASNAIVIGFNVRPDRNAQDVAEREEVDVRLHSVIYNVTEEIKKGMAGLLEPTFKEVRLGVADVRNTFKVPKFGTIAGCMVTEGRITRGGETQARLVRDGVLVHEGRIGSLRRFKDDVSEVKAGFECGIGFEKFNDIKVGDVIEVLSSDQGSRTDIPAWLLKAGHELVRKGETSPRQRKAIAARRTNMSTKPSASACNSSTPVRGLLGRSVETGCAMMDR